MFSLEKLDYSYNDLEPYIDKETMRIHYEKHYQAYTNNLNDALSNYPSLNNKKSIEDLLSNLKKIPKEIRTKVTNNGGGYLNHNLFWKFMTPNRTSPNGEILDNLASTFGDLEMLREKFSNNALSIFGSGWGWLVIKSGKLKIISTANQNTPYSQGMKPLLGIDVWEHSYYLKYQNKRADYINAWWNVINWDYVSSLFLK